MKPLKVERIDEDLIKIYWNDDVFEVCDDSGLAEDEWRDMEYEDIYDALGDILHGIQQGIKESLTIHGYKVEAILMDQTAGVVSQWDIFKTNHPERPYQRMSDILEGKFKV